MSLPLPTIDQNTSKDLQSDIINRLNLAANNYKDQRKFKAAEIMYRRAFNMLPDNAKLMTNLAAALYHLKRFNEAKELLTKSLDKEPDYAMSWSNLALVEQALGNAHHAEHLIEHAIKLEPNNMGAIWDRGTILLENGKWAQGLEDFDARIQFRGEKYYRSFPVPTWQGQDLNNKTIYVQGEQGIGDRILFSRYLVWLKKKYPQCRILYCCNHNLINLLWEYRHFVEFLPETVPWPDNVDYAIFLASLPRFHRTRPDNILKDPGLINKRIENHITVNPANLPEPFLPSLKIGLCWSGNPENIRNEDRSIPLEYLAELADDPRITFYSLQVGPHAKDVRDLGLHEVICDISDELEKYGWIGTAATIKSLDLVITVCTAVAHLAGSLYVPCWTLLCYDPYWVWLRDTNTTNWYPDMRLYRQDKDWNWSPVIDNVKIDLDKLIKQRLII